MARVQIRILSILAAVSIISAALAACSGSSSNSGKAAVRINGYTLTAEEFDSIYKERKGDDDTPEARREFLDLLVMRKLLLQEGQKMGLDRDADFLRTIENFWEQSLLKRVVDKKVSEAADSFTVSEEEVQAYYRRWLKENPGTLKTLDDVRSTLEWSVAKDKEAQFLESWTESLHKQANVEIDSAALGIE